MNDKKRCLGFSESTLKRCKRFVSKSRLEEDRVTCDQHSEQDDIAKRYLGDVDDDLRIVEHFLREEGLISAKIVNEQPIEQAQKPALTKEYGRDLSTLSVTELRRLKPQQFEKRTKWKAFEDGLTEKDFLEGQALQKGEGSHRAAVFGALAKNAKEFGFFFATLAAVVSAFCLVLYYLFLGFGFQSVVVDPTSVTATALLAIFLAAMVFSLGNSRAKQKDRARKNLHQRRYKWVIKFLKQRENMSAKSERISSSIDVCIRGKEKQENAKITARYLSLLQRKRKAEGNPWNKLAQFVSKLYSRLIKSSPPAAEPQRVELSKVTALELMTLEDAPIGDRIKELQSRNAVYSAAEKDLKSQQNAAWSEGEIECLNQRIAEDDAELKRLNTQSLWVLLSFSWRPYVFTCLGLVGAMLMVASLTRLVVNNADWYCNQWLRPINCFYLELSQPGGSSEVTTFHKVAFVHGRVLDHYLVSSLGTEKDAPTTEGIARMTIPFSSVVGMQRYGRSYTRMGPSDPIVPVVNLSQENTFAITNNTALASGGGGGTNTTTLNYDAKFPVHNREVTQLTLNNDFRTDVLVREEVFPMLVSNFILDGKKMQEPGDGEFRHILVPFFLDLVQSDGSKRREIYAVEDGPSIDTELDAFMAGFFSLSDPEFDLEDPPSKELANPTNLLSMVRTALSACRPGGATGATLKIDISGYSSEMPFRRNNGDVISTDALLNHAVAEGRRLAVLANVVDYDLSLLERDKAKIILSPREETPEQVEFSVPVLTFIKLLKRDNPSDLVAFLENVDRVALLEKLKREVFRFTSKDEMNAHLKLWVPSEHHANEPVREAFQRSAVISISKEEIKKCGL